MTKHIFRLRESVMVVQLNTRQSPRDPGPKPFACCAFNTLLFKMPKYKSDNRGINGKSKLEKRKFQICMYLTEKGF